MAEINKKLWPTCEECDVKMEPIYANEGFRGGTFGKFVLSHFECPECDDTMSDETYEEIMHSPKTVRERF